MGLENSKEWSKPLCGVTHFVRDRIQHTISNYKNFAEFYTYNWNTYTSSEKYVFFVLDLGEDCYDNARRFWNCGSIGKAIEVAKHYAIGSEEFRIYANQCRQDMSVFINVHMKEIISNYNKDRAARTVTKTAVVLHDDLKRIISDLISSRIKEEDGADCSAETHFNVALCKLLKYCPDYTSKNPEFLEVIEWAKQEGSLLGFWKE